jgi:hypothetical protein
MIPAYRRRNRLQTMGAMFPSSAFVFGGGRMGKINTDTLNKLGQACLKDVKKFAKLIYELHGAIMDQEARFAKEQAPSFKSAENCGTEIQEDIRRRKQEIAKKLLSLNNLAYRCKLPPVLDGAEGMPFDRIANICVALMEDTEQKGKEASFLAEKENSK